MRRFNVGDKMACAHPELHVNINMTKIPKGAVVTVIELCPFFNDSYVLAEYETDVHGEICSYSDKLFEPLISTTQQFVEVTFTKIIETVPKTCAS